MVSHAVTRLAGAVLGAALVGTVQASTINLADLTPQSFHVQSGSSWTFSVVADTQGTHLLGVQDANTELNESDWLTVTLPSQALPLSVHYLTTFTLSDTPAPDRIVDHRAASILETYGISSVGHGQVSSVDVTNSVLLIPRTVYGVADLPVVNTANDPFFSSPVPTFALTYSIRTDHPPNYGVLQDHCSWGQERQPGCVVWQSGTLSHSVSIDVLIGAVPEPQAFDLALAGMAALGWAACAGGRASRGGRTRLKQSPVA